MAGPPETLNVVDKWIKQHAMMNLVGCMITTNHRSDGLYIPPEDRRIYAAWTDVLPAQFPDQYWNDFANWLIDGGTENVAHYLATLDVRDFDPKARPPKTEFWWAMVNASGHTAETSGLLDVLDTVAIYDEIGEKLYPAVATVDSLIRWARAGGYKYNETVEWLSDRSKRRQYSHRLEQIGYTAHNNDAGNEGRCIINGRRQVVYVLRELSADQRRETVRLFVEFNGDRLVYVRDDQTVYDDMPGTAPDLGPAPWEMEEDV